MSQLPLPIAPETAITKIIRPGLELLPARMMSDRAIVLILAIFLQESGLKHRWQVVDLKQPQRKGPARGLGQFELGGGVTGVFNHSMTRNMLANLCQTRRVPFDTRSIYEALDDDDLLAVGLSRLLLFTDSAPLPEVGAVEGAWQYYLRNWRPGAHTRGTTAQKKALRTKWGVYYAEALAAWDAVEA